MPNFAVLPLLCAKFNEATHACYLPLYSIERALVRNRFFTKLGFGTLVVVTENSVYCYFSFSIVFVKVDTSALSLSSDSGARGFPLCPY